MVGRRKGDTSKKIERASHQKAHAWFVAYAPSDNPKIAVSVIVENGEHGSSAAAPIAREIIKAYLQRKKPRILTKDADATDRLISLNTKPNPDKPVGAKRKSRFIGEPKMRRSSKLTFAP